MKQEFSKACATALNNLLADQFVLLTKILDFHWNVTGRQFMSDHLFFEKLYQEAFDSLDDIAERIRVEGGRPVASLKGILSHNRIKEYEQDKPIPEAKEMYVILAKDYEMLINEILKDIDTLTKEEAANEGALSFLSDMVSRVQKSAWMIKSHIE